MEREWRENGERMERGWRENGERMERGWREDGKRVEREQPSKVRVEVRLVDPHKELAVVIQS